MTEATIRFALRHIRTADGPTPDELRADYQPIGDKLLEWIVPRYAEPDNEGRLRLTPGGRQAIGAR